MRQFIQIADGLDTVYTPRSGCERLQQPHREGSEDNRHQTTGDTFGELWHEDANQQREYTHR